MSKRKQRSESKSAEEGTHPVTVKGEGVKDIYAGTFSHYNKYEKESWCENRDRFICLSTDLDSANKKTVAATTMYQEDSLGDDFEGTASEPCSLQFTPMGGGYVLTVDTQNISESFRKMEEQRLRHGFAKEECYFTRMIGRAPLSEVVELLSAFGLAASVEALPAKLKNSRTLAPAVAFLLQKDHAGASNFLATCTSSPPPAAILKDSRFVDEDVSWFYAC